MVAWVVGVIQDADSCDLAGSVMVSVKCEKEICVIFAYATSFYFIRQNTVREVATS